MNPDTLKESTLKTLATMAGRVQAAAAASDDERAHAGEDRHMVVALEAILRGAADPAEIAAVALSTQDLGFARWCA